MGLRDRGGGGGGIGGGGGLRGGGPGGPVRYQMREKMFSIGDDAWIEDSNGNRAYKADGKALRMRSTFVLEDANGNEVASIQEKMLHIKDTMEIERGGQQDRHGQEGARLTRARPLRRAVSRAARTGTSRATSSITSTRSRAVVIRSPRSR